MKFHKNFHLVALFAAMIALNAQAAPVESPAQVVRAVSAWAAANGSAFARPGSVVDVEAVKDDDGATVLYWIARMSNGGAVIASPDTDLDLVIAVLEKYDGSFPVGHPLPSVLKRDMRNRLSIVRSGSASAQSGRTGLLSVSLQSASAQSSMASSGLSDDVKESVRKANAQWEKYGSARGGVGLLGESLDGGDSSSYVRRIVDGFENGGRYTHWNQDSSGGKPCYNFYTPDGVVCGCVATAGAAILQFFGCSTDIGEVVGEGCLYDEKPYPCATMPGEIDWSIIPTNNAASVRAMVATNDVARELLGRVTYNLGVLVGMSWAEDGSGAQTRDLVEAFKKYGFKTARYVDFGLSGSAEQFFKTIYTQTWGNAPVVLSINGAPGGHAVVACGYARDQDGDEFCRVFMGWGGSSDAWYKFPEIDDFSLVLGAVTMIGFEDDAVVPVCGRSNIPDSRFSIPGYEKETVDEESGETVSSPVVIATDANGYFAVRIPASLSAPKLVHESTGKQVDIHPFSSKILADEKSELGKLVDAIPDEVFFLGLDMATKFSVESARETALRDGKAVLMISGSGSVEESLLIDYVTHLDSTTDMSNRFVFVHVNSSDMASLDGDGDPTIGVFDPATGSAEDGWHGGNGRLAYSTFIDYDADNQDGVKYVFSESDTTALTNIVLDVLNSGFDIYSRRHSGISVTVRAVDEAGALLSVDGYFGNYGLIDVVWTNDAVLAVAPTGVFTNCWTNGEEVVFSVPSVCTNAEFGVVLACVGYTLDGDDDISEGCEVALSLCAGNEVGITWHWAVKAYRVSASTYGLVGAPADAVSPVESWRAPGDRVTVVATNFFKGSGLDYWNSKCAWSSGDYLSKYGVTSGQYAWPKENGTAYSLTVYEPLNLVAVYSSGAGAKSAPTTNVVSISVNPPELAELIETDGSLSVGTNETFDGYASFAAMTSDVVDSTGGVWRCTGYVLGGVTNSLPQAVPLSLGSEQKDVELLWELQEPEIVIPEPGPISIKGIARGSDGKWTITVSGALKDCWYWLYSSDDLSTLAGDSESWTATVAAGPQQATEDGDIVFNVEAAGGSLFWRAKAKGTSE